LIPGNAELLRIEIEHPDAFSEKLGAEVPPNWPPETMRPVHLHFLQQLEQNPKFTGWLTWYWLLKRPVAAPLIGCGGFKGRPAADGGVEIGYSVLPQYQGHGYATEAVSSLVAWAFSHRKVSHVIAETSSNNLPSQRVLEKLFFVPFREGQTPDMMYFKLKRKT
jgi:RimJ/RimL family protein N-acetyltransferase